MKTIQTEITVFECGDIIDISDVDFRSATKDKIEKGHKALIINAHNGLRGYSYKVVTERATSFTIKPDEAYGAKYAGHIDLSALFG